MTIFATDQYAIQAIVRITVFSLLTTSPDEVYSRSYISVLYTIYTTNVQQKLKTYLSWI